MDGGRTGVDCGYRFVQSRNTFLLPDLNPGGCSLSEGFPLSGSTLVVISGTSLAGDTLFDDCKDCPYRTRLRSGEIADLTLSR